MESSGSLDDRDLVQRLAQQLPLSVVKCCDPLAEKVVASVPRPGPVGRRTFMGWVPSRVRVCGIAEARLSRIEFGSNGRLLYAATYRGEVFVHRLRR